MSIYRPSLPSALVASAAAVLISGARLPAAQRAVYRHQSQNKAFSTATTWASKTAIRQFGGVTAGTDGGKGKQKAIDEAFAFLGRPEPSSSHARSPLPVFAEVRGSNGESHQTSCSTSRQAEHTSASDSPFTNSVDCASDRPTPHSNAANQPSPRYKPCELSKDKHPAAGSTSRESTADHDPGEPYSTASQSSSVADGDSTIIDAESEPRAILIDLARQYEDRTLTASSLEQCASQVHASLPTKQAYTYTEAILMLINEILCAKYRTQADTTPPIVPPQHWPPSDSTCLGLASHLHDLYLVKTETPDVAAKPARRQVGDTLPLFFRKLLRSGDFGHAKRAARMVCDANRRRSSNRMMIRTAIPLLRQVCEDSLQRKLGHDGERLRLSMLQTWTRVIDEKIRDGTMQTMIPSDGAGRASRGDHLSVGDFLKLAAEYGTGTEVLRICRSMRDMARSAVEQSTPTSPAMPPPPTLILHHSIATALIWLLSHRGLYAQASLILAMVPLHDRSARDYEVLLSEYGEGDARLDLESPSELADSTDIDPISAIALGRGGSSSSHRTWYPPSKPFQDHLWTQALNHPRIARNDTTLLRLFSARMISHAKVGSVHMLEEDVRAMVARELTHSSLSKRRLQAADGSFTSAMFDIEMDTRTLVDATFVLPRKGQVGVLQTLMRAGQSHRCELVAEDLMRLHREQRGGKGPRKGDDTAKDGSHILNASTGGLLHGHNKSLVRTSIDPRDFLDRLDHFVNQLQVQPDDVTRNTILYSLARSTIPSIRPGDGMALACKSQQQRRPLRPQSTAAIVATMDLLVRCGVLECASTSPAASKIAHWMDNYRTRPIESLEEARRFKHTGASLLKALIDLLYSRGWTSEGRQLVSILKEGEKVADQFVLLARRGKRKDPRKVRQPSQSGSGEERSQ